MERDEFTKLATAALEHLETGLADLEHDTLDVDLAGDVLTIAFDDGAEFIINAHSAAGQVWMAANRNAWHFDYNRDAAKWVSSRNQDELVSTVCAEVGRRLGIEVRL